jgi:hypothetical protein
MRVIRTSFLNPACWQKNGERAALMLDAGHPYRPPMRSHDVLHHGEADAASLDALRRCGRKAHELLEDALLVGGGDADAYAR